MLIESSEILSYLHSFVSAEVDREDIIDYIEEMERLELDRMEKDYIEEMERLELDRMEKDYDNRWQGA